MDDAGLVRVFERRRQLQRDVHHVLIRHRTAREAVGERGPVDELHDQGKAAACFLDPVNLRDVLMIERGERLRFAFEARQILGVRGDAREEHLDGDFAVESHVVGAIDLAHAAGPKGGDYLIRADPGTGCEWHADTDGLEAAKLSRMMRDRTRTLAAFLGCPRARRPGSPPPPRRTRRACRSCSTRSWHGSRRAPAFGLNT